MQHIQWDKLKTFYYVAKCMSFTKTGTQLNISQSSISRQMAILEDRLGYQLFKRLPRGLALTSNGELLFDNVKKMFSYAELAQNQLQESHKEPSGNLSIGANVGLVDTWLYQAIPGFLKKYPKINCSICSKDGALDVESLELHVALQPYLPNKPGMIQNLLMTWNRRLYASRDYLEKYGTPRTVSDLKNHQLIGFGTESIHLFENINWHLSLDKSNGKVLIPYLSANSVRAIFHFGNSGLGIISYSQESPLLRGSNLVEVLPEIKGPAFDIYFTYPEQLADIKRIEALEIYLQDYVKQHHCRYELGQAK